MDLAAFPDDFFQIDIDVDACRQAGVEGGCRFSPGLTNLIRFKRAFDDISD